MDGSEKIVRVEKDLLWLPQPHEARLVISSRLPPQELVSTSLVLAFAGDRLLMTHLRKRGWDIPGGHVEPGEQPEETVRREVREETGAILGPLHLLGYQHLRLLGPRPDNYRYPYPDCYQTFYWARVTSLEDFLPTEETQGRALFTPAEAYLQPWVQLHTELYEAALITNMVDKIPEN